MYESTHPATLTFIVKYICLPMDCLILEYLPNVHILTQICNLCFFPLIFVDFQQKCDHSENTDSKETSKNLFQGFSFERLACILA